MTTSPEQKKRLLKAKIAVALQDEAGTRVIRPVMDLGSPMAERLMMPSANTGVE